MNNKKLLSTLAFLLLAPPLFAEELFLPDMKAPARQPRAINHNRRMPIKPMWELSRWWQSQSSRVIIYAISTVEFMEQIEFRRIVTMPDVDATLLSIFGLRQVAYLGKKATGGTVAFENAFNK